MEAGHLMAPGKDLFTAPGLGCRVEWVAATRTMVVRRGEVAVRVKVGSNVALADGQKVALGAKTMMRDGAVYVAPRAIAEKLGLRVTWDPGSYMLSIEAR
jgi:Copper amine oxidase N-terminal domain